MSLEEKAISIRGKKYILVKDRINFFHETYPNGSIKTKSDYIEGQALFVAHATVTPDINQPDRIFTGMSQAKVGGPGVNAQAALENAETSAVGRALGLMGIGVIDSIASADELKKAGVTTDDF